MTWELELRRTSADLGRRLEQAHPNPPGRRRLRDLTAAAAILLVAGAAVHLARPRDPAEAIGEQYAVEFTDVKIEDPVLRREFEAALAQVDRAIALAKDAVRRVPGNPDFVELCHVAHRAKVRLIRAYTQGG